MPGIYIALEIAVLSNCIGSIHQLPYKLYFQKSTFYMLYSTDFNIFKRPVFLPRIAKDLLRFFSAK